MQQKGGGMMGNQKRRKLRLGCLFLALAAAGLALAPRALPALPAGGANYQVTVPADPPMVAITFDDGPRDTTTTRLLDELALREVQATFFLVGARLSGNEDLVRRMAAAGPQVGVHSYTHIFINNLAKQDFDFEVGQTRMQLKEILGDGSFWLRPPYGITDSSVENWAGSPIILWSVDPEDWKDRNVERMVQLVLGQVKDGDIILFHDIYESSVDAALQVVDALLQEGYYFVTAEQLLQAKGVTPENGVIYRQVR